MNSTIFCYIIEMIKMCRVSVCVCVYTHKHTHIHIHIDMYF